MQADVGERYPGVGEGEDRQDGEGDPPVQAVLQVPEGRVTVFIGRPQWNGQCQGDARQGRVHPGLEHAHPHDDADDHVGGNLDDAHQVEGYQHAERDRAGGQRQHGYLRRIENRDDDDGAEIVEDGDRRKQHLQREGDPLAEQGQDSERERDVGRRRNGPAVDVLRVPEVEAGIDQRRNHHAAHRGDGRQGCLRHR